MLALAYPFIAVGVFLLALPIVIIAWPAFYVLSCALKGGHDGRTAVLSAAFMGGVTAWLWHETHGWLLISLLIAVTWFIGAAMREPATSR